MLVATVVAQMLMPKPEESQTFLTVADRGLEPEELSDLIAATSSSGKLLRECGVTEMLVKRGHGVHGVPYALTRAEDLKTSHSHCIIRRAIEGGYDLGLLNIKESEINAL